MCSLRAASARRLLEFHGKRKSEKGWSDPRGQDAENDVVPSR